MRVSDTQARIAKALVPGPKTLEELAKELDLKPDEVKTELEALMKLGLVRLGKEKYRLVEAVRRGLETGEKLNPEEYKFRAYVIIEGISENKEVLEKLQKQVIDKFKKDPNFEILDLNVEEIIENEGVYSSMFEAEVVAKTFHDLVYLVLMYGPSSIELIEPAKFEIKASEAQNILVDTAEMIHAYSQIIADLQKRLGPQKPKIQLKINKKEG